MDRDMVNCLRPNRNCDASRSLITFSDIRSAPACALPVMDQVWQGSRKSDVVVADITEHNPNVFYEVGLAHALGKEVIILSQTGVPPFDIRAARHIVYDPGRLDLLTTAVENALRAVPARYPHEGPEPPY